MRDVYNTDYENLDTIDLAKDTNEMRLYQSYCDDGIIACEILTEAYNPDNLYSYDGEPLGYESKYKMFNYAYDMFSKLKKFDFEGANKIAPRISNIFWDLYEDKEIVTMLKSNIDLLEDDTIGFLKAWDLLLGATQADGLRQYFDINTDVMYLELGEEVSRYSYKGQPLDKYVATFNALAALEDMDIK